MDSETRLGTSTIENQGSSRHIDRKFFPSIEDVYNQNFEYSKKLTEFGIRCRQTYGTWVLIKIVGFLFKFF